MCTTPGLESAPYVPLTAPRAFADCLALCCDRGGAGSMLYHTEVYQGNSQSGRLTVVWGARQRLFAGAATAVLFLLAVESTGAIRLLLEENLLAPRPGGVGQRP